MIDRIEPHDTLDEVRDFLRSLPNGGSDDLARKVTAALYTERSKPARDAAGWCDMGAAPKGPEVDGHGPRIIGWGKFGIARQDEPERAVFMEWINADAPG